MRDEKKSSDWIKLVYAFIGGTLLAVVASAVLKPILQEKPTSSIEKPKLEAKLPVEKLIKFDSYSISNKSDTIHLSKELISNAAYEAFYNETGYESVNERLGTTPNWRSSYKKAEDPVINLHMEDILTFLHYLQDKISSKQSYDSLGSAVTLSSKLFFRLPKVEELEKMGERALTQHHAWEWTSSSLRDVDPSLPNATDYLSFWRLTEEEKNPQIVYLRERDLKINDLNQVGFRIAWSFPSA
ncbi:MAG: hypothetical protein GWP59_03405 [Chlamydiales bacterium]|nr:hypothetical protein [Chlamydiales bacterium]